MPTPEMLKKLLDEFAEKEAHTSAEINTINEQIAELEERIIQSKQKLAAVGVDREKVVMMLSRYKTGAWVSAGAPATPPGNGAKSKQPEPTAPAAEPASQAKLSMPSPRTSSTKLKPKNH